MAAVGARARRADKIVQVKVYAPDHKTFNQDKLANYLNTVMVSSDTPVTNLSDYIGHDLQDKLKDTSALWVVVEVHNTNNNAFTEETYLLKDDVDA